MNSLYLKSENAITFCMHTEKMHIFYLKECEQSKHLIVIEEDLLSNGLVNSFVVPKGRNIEAAGYILQFNKKSGYLMLSYPPCRFVIWNVNTQETILFTETRGKNPYFINNFTFNDSSRVLFFSAVGQRNVYCSALVEDNNTFSFQKNTKLQLPKKIVVLDLKCQPNDKRLLAACSDGIIRIWNSESLSPLRGLSDPQSQSNEVLTETQAYSKHYFTCLEFSSDGQRLLAGTNYGQVYCFDSRSLGNKHLTLASINVGSTAILSCKWLQYNGLSSSKNQNFIVYTSQISLKLFKYSFQGNLPSLMASKAPNVQQKASAQIVKVQDLYNHRQEIKLQDFYGINLQFEKFLYIHEFANFFAFNTFKTKAQFSQQNKNSFKHTIQIYTIYDKLYDKIDFPIVSPQFNHSFEQLLPNDQKQVLFQRSSYTIEQMDIKMLQLGHGTIRTVASLKQILMSEDVKFYGLDTRPLKMDYSTNQKYLLFYKMDDHYYTTTFSVNIERSEEEAKKEDSINNYLATQSQQAIFLGESHYSNPPIYYLDENMQSFAVDCHTDKIEEQISKLLQEQGYQIKDDEISVKGDLSQKIERIFSTPFQKGFVILYLLADNNRLCFSRNRLPGYRLLDFELGLPLAISSQSNASNNNYVFIADEDDTVIDVVWQNMNTDNPAVQIGAIICINKIHFVNGNLQKIKTIKVCPSTSANLISSAKWFGSALIFITRTHVQYACIDGTTNCILSLDSYESKQWLVEIMIDRIIIASKSNIKKKQAQAQVDYKIKVFSPVEPLICGYIANCKYLKREIREKDICQIIETYQTSFISSTLLQSLQKEKLHHLCYFYIYNSENKQLPCGQKVEILEQMLKTEGILDLLFPSKNLKVETDIIEILKRMQQDPRAVGEAQTLQYLCQYYLLIGEFERALIVCHLLQDFRKMFIISKSTNIQPLMNAFAANYLNSKIGLNIHKNERYILQQAVSEDSQGQINQTDDSIESFYTTDNFSYNIINSIESGGKSIRNSEVLQEIAQLDEELAQYLKRVINRKDIQQSSLGFGQQLFSQVFIDKLDEDDDDQNQNLQVIEHHNFENITDYLGIYSSFIEASKMHQGGQSAHAGGGFGQQGMNEDMAGEAAGEEEEDQDENKDILILWRFDEGKGNQIGDLSNYEIEGQIISENGQQDKVWNLLQESDPLEIEDIWGKKVPHQYSIVFSGEQTFNGIKTLSEKWCNKQKKIKEFTLEMWIKAKGGDGPVFRVMNQNETSFEVRIKQQDIQVFVKNNPIKFVAFKEEEDENNQKDNSKSNAQQGNGNNSIQIPQNVWTHLSIQYEDSAKLSLFLNCKELYQSEEDLDIVTYETFKSKALYIGSNTFIGEITEFRLRKEKLTVNQIRDQYKTPLPIVYEKKKQIKFKVKKGDNKDDNKPKNQFNFSMPPIIDDNMNQFNTNAFNSTNQDENKQSSKPANPFAFSMPPIIQDDVPSQQVDAGAGIQKENTESQQQKNPFVFQMPTIIKDDEYEIKNNQDEEEQKQSQNQQIPAQKNSDQKQNVSIDKPTSNFDDFGAFGTFTQTPQVNKNRSDSNAFSQFQSYSGAQASTQQQKDFGDPFSQFSTQSKPNQGKNDSFSNFGNDATSAFGNFGTTSNAPKIGSNSHFDAFKQSPAKEGGDFNNNNFFGGFGSSNQVQEQNNSFSNFGEPQTKK
ncbi:hypothetical protein TTHERM_00455260 (macronuclear) [Tetrahymena thermophila SB210]|uniref:WD domain, G-beta repeat protein n=1 Tax=Tetrahymena thermophila (strain SB210) TaxID=312017 RepID=I7LX73_TETTS|nr:hypothetical protein TTHERM_00455260 [Tetrahymena thermophila SB210]EAS03887.2 hypothetical protein TTHERM_00455260 [Tetrahymena thermophila SB210]|eukprot:XP_001024132.2 hypothetical protein TTHERM_00455260 [Tetrahymena thermophila SB210]